MRNSADCDEFMTRSDNIATGGPISECIHDKSKRHFESIRQYCRAMEQMTIVRAGEVVRRGANVTVRFDVRSTVVDTVSACVHIDARIKFEARNVSSESVIEGIARDALLAVLDPA